MSASLDRARELGPLGHEHEDRTAAIDATGLEVGHASLHFRRRTGRLDRDARHAAWPKLTAVFQAGSQFIGGIVTSRGPSQDSPESGPAMRQAAANLHPLRVVADKGHDAEHNHALCRRELGIRSTVIPLNPRNHGRRWPKTRDRRLMKRRFPARQCSQRTQAESAFSRHTRRLGSALSARSELNQFAEVRLRVPTHNIMILADAG